MIQQFYVIPKFIFRSQSSHVIASSGMCDPIANLRLVLCTPLGSFFGCSAVGILNWILHHVHRIFQGWYLLPRFRNLIVNCCISMNLLCDKAISCNRVIWRVGTYVLTWAHQMSIFHSLRVHLIGSNAIGLHNLFPLEVLLLNTHLQFIKML